VNLYPIQEVLEAVQKHRNAGATFHQQFNCAHCGAKQTIEEPNKLFAAGQCEECGQLTNIIQNGCNYLLIFSSPEQQPQTHLSEQGE